jgi:hypothetical protein
MFFRIADELSLAALALLDMDVVLPNWPETRTGQELQVPIAVRNGGQTALSVVGMGATSPFASATVKLEMPNLPSVVAPGEVQEATLRIAMGDAGRTVLPVLVSVAARRGQIEATARRLLDVRIRPLAAG